MKILHNILIFLFIDIIVHGHVIISNHGPFLGRIAAVVTRTGCTAVVNECKAPFTRRRCENETESLRIVSDTIVFGQSDRRVFTRRRCRHVQRRLRGFDGEVELLLSRVDDYRTSTCVDWDTVRLKHIVIGQVFPNSTRAGEYLEEICAVHGLAQHVKTATRGNNPLDLILSDLGDRVSVDVTSPIGRSDHSVLLTKIATCPQREKRTSRRVWRYSKADWGRLGKFYRDVEWSKIISSDPNLACKGVTETILDGMHRHIPNKRLTTRPSDPSWWTPECTAAVQAKRRSWDRLHKYPSKENEDLYKTHCARCVACLHNAKERGLAAVRQRLKSGSLQDKQWWSTLKAAGGDGRQCTIPVIRDDKGNEHTTSMDKASCFGKHFSAKCSVKEDLHQSDLPHFPRRCDTICHGHGCQRTRVRSPSKYTLPCTHAHPFFPPSGLP